MNYRVTGWMLIAMLLCLPGMAAGKQPCTLLILGDSLSSGYGLDKGTGWVDLLSLRLQSKHPGWNVINASISGDTTQNGLQRLRPALERHAPKGVLIELGGNDALRGTPPHIIRQNLVSLIRQAKSAGAWVALFEAPVLPNYGKAYANGVARMYAEVARTERVLFVPCFVCNVARTPGMMQADAIHPNEKAQSPMLDAVWPHIQAKLRCSK